MHTLGDKKSDIRTLLETLERASALEDSRTVGGASFGGHPVTTQDRTSALQRIKTAAWRELDDISKGLLP